MKEITERQQRVLTFIEEYFEKEGLPPTVREVADGLGFKSVNGVREHLRLIEKKGFVELRKGVARGIFLVKKPQQSSASIVPEAPSTSLPIIGKVSAGTPIVCEENIEGSIYVDQDLFHGNNQFIFRVDGESMLEAGIFDSDFVIIERQQVARDGEIVVVQLNGEITLKTFFKKEDHIVLHPENQFYSDIIVQPFDSFQIVGKMVGLIRKY